MEKVYELPDLAPAPASDLQALLRRFIEYADWGAVRPLLDCLNEAGRHEDAIEVKRLFGKFFTKQVSEPDWLCPRSMWDYRVDDLMARFAFDLFAPEACVALMRPVDTEVETGMAPAGYAGVVVPINTQFTAEEEIPAGSPVALDHVNHTVRVHPAPQPVQPAEVA